jgi:hypothetical protein
MIPSYSSHSAPTRTFFFSLSATWFAGMTAAVLKISYLDPVIPDKESHLLWPGNINTKICKEGSQAWPSPLYLFIAHQKPQGETVRDRLVNRLLEQGRENPAPVLDIGFRLHLPKLFLRSIHFITDSGFLPWKREGDRTACEPLSRFLPTPKWPSNHYLVL